MLAFFWWPFIKLDSYRIKVSLFILTAIYIDECLWCKTIVLLPQVPPVPTPCSAAAAGSCGGLPGRTEAGLLSWDTKRWLKQYQDIKKVEVKEKQVRVPKEKQTIGYLEFNWYSYLFLRALYA